MNGKEERMQGEIKRVKTLEKRIFIWSHQPSTGLGYV
jgi:hypothetical protein